MKQSNVIGTTSTNWEEFWSIVNKHTDWDLEWYNPSTLQWVSIKGDMTIQRSYPIVNTCKIKLLFNASQTGNYRLTFAIDKKVKKYVTKLESYQYQLDFDKYSLVFDWSDIMAIPNLIITHGIRQVNGDNYFWFRMRKNNIPIGTHVEIDPSVVGTSTTSTATQLPFQRKTFYAAGRYWVFYSNGTNFVYRTSIDGVTWSSATTIQECVSGDVGSVFFDGTYVHYALCAPHEELVDFSFNNAGEWTGTDWTITGGTAQKNAGTGTDTLSEVHPFTVKTDTTYLITLVIINVGRDGNVYITLGGATSATYTTTGTKTFYLTTTNTNSLGIVGYGPTPGYPGSPLLLASISIKGTDLLYRRGTPNSNGTITWSAAQQTVPLGQFGSNPMIAVDSGGYAWIGCIAAVAGEPVTYSPHVFKNANNNGTWSTDTGFPYQLTEGTTGTTWAVSITPLTGGKVYVLFGRNYPYTVVGRLWSGSSWEDEDYPTGSPFNMLYHSVVANGNDVHFVYYGYNSLEYIKRTYGVGWGEPVVVYSEEGITNTAPVISMDTVTGDLYCFWTGYPTSNHVYYKKCLSGTWDTNPTDWLNETTDTFLTNDVLTCFYQTYGRRIGLLYTTLTTGPFNVKFASLGWTGKINGVTDPAKINGLSTIRIATVMGV